MTNEVETFFHVIRGISIFVGMAFWPLFTADGLLLLSYRSSLHILYSLLVCTSKYFLPLYGLPVNFFGGIFSEQKFSFYKIQFIKIFFHG